MFICKEFFSRNKIKALYTLFFFIYYYYVFTAGNKYIGQSSVFGSALPKVGNVNLNSDGLMGQIAGVTTDKQGNIYVFHRADRVWDGRLILVQFLHI